MNTLDPPKEETNIDLPKYQKITTVVNYSILLRSFVLSKEMEKQCYRLRLQSGSSSDHGNFISVTIEPVANKIFTAIIKNRIYHYLL